MLALQRKFEDFLNHDAELARRLAGFKSFSGVPDGHYRRARAEGISAVARAVKCYPFGGRSLLGEGDWIGLRIRSDQGESRLAIARENQRFAVRSGDWRKPHLTIGLSSELFKKTLLGRYRWLWTIGMDGVEVGYSETLPHSDWVTLLEVLVALQEAAEFDKSLWEAIERL